MEVELILTTVPGIENYVVEELVEKGGKVKQFETIGLTKNSGRIYVKVDVIESLAEIHKLIKSLRTIEKAYLLIDKGFIGKSRRDLEDFCQRINLEPLLNFMTQNTSIAIRCNRVGEHEYTSIDVANVLGRRVIEFVKDKLRFRPIVNLDNPDLTINVDIVEDRYYLSIELTRFTLRDRPYRAYRHPASINPILAYTMNMLLNLPERSKLLICDPTCGSATIPIEGTFKYRKATYLCIDINFNYVRGAKENIVKANKQNFIDLLCADSTYIKNFVKGKVFDAVVFNPPYGVRLEPLEDIYTFYKNLLQALVDVVKDDGYIVLITLRRNVVLKICEELMLDVVNQITVDQGGLLTTIFKLRKKCV